MVCEGEHREHLPLASVEAAPCKRPWVDPDRQLERSDLLLLAEGPSAATALNESLVDERSNTGADSTRVAAGQRMYLGNQLLLQLDLPQR